MTPTDFQFRMRLPCDPRLVPTVRDLAAHAIRYAALRGEDAKALVEHVERAAFAATQVAGSATDGLDVDIRRGPELLMIEVRCPAGCAPTTHSGPDGRLSVRWTEDGAHCACLIAFRTG